MSSEEALMKMLEEIWSSPPKITGRLRNPYQSLSYRYWVQVSPGVYAEAKELDWKFPPPMVYFSQQDERS